MSRSRAWDAVVVGAGPTGLLVAETLCQAGWSCLVLEAGPVPGGPFPVLDEAFLKRTRRYLEVDEDVWRYRASRPFQWLRVRAAGGRTLLWGGWCVPPEPRCLTEAREVGAPWPIRFAELRPFVERAARALRIHQGILHPRLAQAASALGIELMPKWGATAVGEGRPLFALDWRKQATVRGHSAVSRVLRDASGAVAGVEVLAGKARRPRRVRTRVVVLCASPVESARIVHMTDPSGVGAADGPLGRGLVDHMVAGLVVVTEPGPRPVEHMGPLNHAAWFLRPSTARSGESGYVVEVRGPTPATTLSEVDLAEFRIDRREARDLVTFTVHTMAAAAPSLRRRVVFDPGERDALGRPVPVLHLAWSERDRRAARRLDRVARNVAEALAGPSGRLLRVHDPLDPGGVGHEAGTCRMGGRGQESVTDASGAVRGIPGLFVADASILPTLFDRHPTWSLLAVTLRVAHGIVERGRRGEL